MKKIFFITKNNYKLKSMQENMKKFGIEVESIPIDTPEIQARSCEEVAMFSAKWTAEKTGKAVVKADGGLFVESLNGFPGIMTGYIQKTLGIEGLLKLLEGKIDRRAKIVYAVAYCEPSKEPKVFVSGCDGSISETSKGKEGMLIDFIFIPVGQDRTMGEIRDYDGEDARRRFWGDAEERLAKWILENEKESKG